MTVPLTIAAIAGYLLGALPFGYWVARGKGINIFEHGSKNPGATNVRRVCGKGPGNLTFALDAAKGALATSWFYFLPWDAETKLYASVAGLVAALLGHSFSCFTRFRGGKGVATASGGFLVLMPLPLLIALGVWLVTFYTSRFVSLASILAAVALPLGAWALHQPSPVLAVAAVVAVFVIIRHRTNIVRLANGTENKFVKKKESAEVSQ